MHISQLIKELQKLEKTNPNMQVMVSLSDCEMVSPVSFVEESKAHPDTRTGLYRDDLEEDSNSETIALIGYCF